MPTDIDLARLLELLADHAQLIEVLPETEYLEEHLPGAINLPLKRITSEGVATLNRDRPVIVYCWDAL
jgi:rhodanese-related sulfurtransferase